MFAETHHLQKYCSKKCQQAAADAKKWTKNASKRAIEKEKRAARRKVEDAAKLAAAQAVKDAEEQATKKSDEAAAQVRASKLLVSRKKVQRLLAQGHHDTLQDLADILIEGPVTKVDAGLLLSKEEADMARLGLGLRKVLLLEEEKNERLEKSLKARGSDDPGTPLSGLNIPDPKRYRVS